MFNIDGIEDCDIADDISDIRNEGFNEPSFPDRTFMFTEKSLKVLESEDARAHEVPENFKLRILVGLYTFIAIIALMAIMMLA